MNRSSWYFLLGKSFWMISDFTVYMLCEKWVELITGNSTSILIVMLIYYGMIYVASFILDKFLCITKRPIIACIPILIAVAILACMCLYTNTIQVAWIYGFMVLVAFICVLVTTCNAMLMDNRVEANKKPRLLSYSEFLGNVLGVLLFFLGGHYLIDIQSVQVFILIACVGYFIAYLCICLLYLQRKVIDLSEENGNINSTIQLIHILPIFLFSSFFLSELFYANLDPLHTLYLADQADKGQQVAFTLMGCIYVGGALVSLFIPKILKLMNIGYIYLLFFLVLLTYYYFLDQVISIELLYFMLILVGACGRLMNTATLIHLHHHYSNETLGRYVLLYQQGEAVGPFVSFVLITSFTGFIGVSFHTILTICIATIIMPVLTISVILFRQKRKSLLKY